MEHSEVQVYLDSNNKWSFRVTYGEEVRTGTEETREEAQAVANQVLQELKEANEA